MSIFGHRRQKSSFILHRSSFIIELPFLSLKIMSFRQRSLKHCAFVVAAVRGSHGVHRQPAAPK
jgi:hypothetical protein